MAASAVPACRPGSVADDVAPHELALTDSTVVISAESAALALVVDMLVDDRGDVVLLDWRDGEVIVVSPEADTSARFGGKGEGPGEFQGPSNIGAADGRVRVIDQLTGRLQVLDYDGRPLESIRLVPGIVTADITANRIAYTTTASSSDQPLVVVTNGDGEELHRIVAPVAPPGRWDHDAMRREIARGGIPDELRNTVLMAIRPDGGVWTFLAAEGVLQRYDAEGRQVLATAIGLRDKEGILARFREVNRLQRRVVFPLRYVVDLQAIGDDVWLLWNMPPESPGLLTIHGPDGELLSRLTFPEAPRAGLFAADVDRRRIWVATDDGSLFVYGLPETVVESE